MADLRDLTTDAKRLYEALEYLLAQKEEQDKKPDMDLKEIWFTAKSRPFKKHILASQDNVVRRKYLMLLAASLYLNEDTKKRNVQVRFLARILAACEGMDRGIEEVIADGMMLSEKSIDEFQELGDRDLQIALLIDLLLMAYLTGEAEEKQSDFVVGFMAMLGLEEEMVTAIGKTVRGILETDDVAVLEQRRYIKVEYVYCYMKNPPDGILVDDIEQAKNVQAEKIIFLSCHYQALPLIDCDEFAAETIEFSNCIFTGGKGMYSSKKQLILEQCTFRDCDEAHWALKNSRITGCSFENLRLNATYKSFKWNYIFYFLNCEIDNCKFQKNRIIYENEMAYGGIIYSKNSLIENCNFLEMGSSHSRYNDFWAERKNVLISISGGRIYKCKLLGNLRTCLKLLSCYNDAVYSEIESNEKMADFGNKINMEEIFHLEVKSEKAGDEISRQLRR